MLKPRRKLSKKEIKEDKFVQVTMQTKAYIEENYQRVVMITVTVFAVFVLIMAWNYFQSGNEEKSVALLGNAQVEYQNLNYSKAKGFLIRLLDEYSGTDASDQGLFLMANLLYQEGKVQEAKGYYKDFIDSYSGSEILVASGLAGYAACLSSSGDIEEAAEYYERAQRKAPSFVQAPNYLYLAGLNYMKIDDSDRARELFQIIMEEYDESDVKPKAQAKLLEIANS